MLSLEHILVGLDEYLTHVTHFSPVLNFMKNLVIGFAVQISCLVFYMKFNFGAEID